jgi:hypothetical protein
MEMKERNFVMAYFETFQSMLNQMVLGSLEIIEEEAIMQLLQSFPLHDDLLSQQCVIHLS